ncbi:MAG: hypothetical protein Q9186_006707 [Xanthomendoza sp. 1 TL-2023]
MATTTASPPPSDDRARLRSHFNGPESTHPDRWAQLWEAGDFLPWDRGGPNPALIDLLNEKRAIIGDYFVEDANGSKRRKTALVPGCGRGYDVLLLANYGYDAYGLEVSEKAVERCYEEKKVNEHKYMRKGHSNNAGTSTFIKGDFFDTQWVHAVPGGKFDLIYDYTFLCALTPGLRPAWSQRMLQLLSTDPPGQLICLEFPTYKDPSTGGPPFGLTPQTYVEHLSHPGEELPYDETGHVQVGSQGRPKPASLERLHHWQPERTHEIGKGTDWVSVWQHR